MKRGGGGEAGRDVGRSRGLRVVVGGGRSESIYSHAPWSFIW